MRSLTEANSGLHMLTLNLSRLSFIQNNRSCHKSGRKSDYLVANCNALNLMPFKESLIKALREATGVDLTHMYGLAESNHFLQ